MPTENKTETPAKIAIIDVQKVILPMLKTPTLVADMAKKASQKLGVDVPEQKVRSAIDRARRGSKTEKATPIDRVAPNTFQLSDAAKADAAKAAKAS